MREEFFAKEVNEVLGDIDDYYGLADAIRFFAEAEIKQEQKNSLWNEAGRGPDISF